MGYSGEPTNFAGGDRFIELVTEEDLEVLRVKIPALIKELKSSLRVEDIKVFNHRVNSKVISITVDGGNQCVFPEVPAIGIALVRVSSASDTLKDLPRDFYHTVRYRNLSPLFNESVAELKSKREEEMDRLWEDPRLQRFSTITGITRDDIGSSYLKNPEQFVAIARDIVEWAYITYIFDKHKNIDVVVAKDGRLEQHGVEISFVQKLRTYFEEKNAKVVGVIKSSKLLNGSSGISLMVVAEWIRDVERQLYFRVPDKLMDYVHLHERVWNPDFANNEGDFVGFTFGRRYIGKMYPQTFKPLDTLFSLEIPSYFDNNSDKIDEMVGAIITNRSLLFGGSFAPTLEAHAKASISDHIRIIVQDHMIKETGFRYPF